jgi:hypothetical protein
MPLHLPIANPCTADWTAMEGSDARRFCGMCQMYVHDLSAMELDEVERVLARRGSERVCVRYTRERDGSVKLRGKARAAWLATALAACTPTGVERVTADDGGADAGLTADSRAIPWESSRPDTSAPTMGEAPAPCDPAPKMGEAPAPCDPAPRGAPTPARDSPVLMGKVTDPEPLPGPLMGDLAP